MKWDVFFTDIFFRNWQTKIACVLFSLLFFILYNVYSLSSLTFLIPVNYRTVPYLTLSNDFISEINITIKGKEDVLSKLQPTDFAILVNAENLVEEGTYTLPVLISVKNLNYAKVIQYTPKVSSLSLTLERKAMSLVPVIPQITDSPDSGYDLKSLTVSPTTIPIEGPNSLLSHIGRIFTNPISLKGHTESFSRTTQLSLPKTISALESPSVLLKVEIQPKRETISLSNVPIRPINQSPLVEVIGVIQSGWITISFDRSNTPPLSSSKNIDISTTASLVVDLSGIDQSGSYTIPVQLITNEQNRTFLFHPLSIMVNVRRSR